eukprot:scaffold10056_cov93-Isochrysis_galbana.AAC.5
MHQRLLPHGAPLGIVDVVDLVRHHHAEIVQIHISEQGARSRGLGGGRRRCVWAFDQLVPQNLRGADDELVGGAGGRPDLDISGQECDARV